MAHDTAAEIARFSDNPDFDFAIRTILGHSAEGASDPGEVLAATAGIKKHDHQAWFAAWRDLGQRTSETATASSAAAHRVSAAEAYLRASAYFGVAVNAVSALPDDSALATTFQKQQDAWDGFVAHTAVAVERVDIPYALSFLPGFFFRPAAAVSNGSTLVAVNGSDGSLASLWAGCVSAALKRGYNVLVFDGPGQQSQLFTRDIPFRPDWENVLTPVYDYVSRLTGVESDRIALYGVSQGGYWVPRALAFEHRYAAAIADPGVVDVSASWTGHLPKRMLKLIDAGQKEKFDKEMALGMRLSPGTERTWKFRARPYGTQGYAETIETVRTYTLRDVAGAITTPMLVTDPEGEQFWPGQSEELAHLAPSISSLVPFTAVEGASGHCQPLARAVTAQRMFDWLDEKLAR